MPVSRLRKNRKKPFYTQTIVEPMYVWRTELGQPVRVENKRYPGIVHIKHKTP
jgi:hypothetical protein